MTSLSSSGCVFSLRIYIQAPHCPLLARSAMRKKLTAQYGNQTLVRSGLTQYVASNYNIRIEVQSVNLFVQPECENQQLHP